ncbi:DUF1684 domain-containing protein [Wenyingzhuangia sp. chi5]|uniref:DUF1684 domain-containing protein n=1 Tax=Wenyingzhuangia gilva TaxID=3057677 RepID=A0ABT8VNK4_9FLAO|nr:DUF1684 domain-containing protein [Wenyingzhuangia sp. chi5]MDO3693534.1 DUF1684 domain-containing protein [Wenyingzhuangia sp. chi5]
MYKILLIFLFLSTFSIAQNKDYQTEIKEHRKELNVHFKDKNESPLPHHKIKNFTGLPFFPANEKYKVKAKLEFTFNTPVMYIQDTKGSSEAYQQYALATFKIDGKEFQLSIYQNLELKKKKGYENYLFIPFTDLSNGKTTYAGGRYMDTTIPDEYTGYIILDFNKAYNPYCAYNKNYICPVPPKNNHLNTSILAGVKY